MLKAFRTGWQDGIEQPYEITMGMSYENNTRQFLWDIGSILGQGFGKLRG